MKALTKQNGSLHVVVLLTVVVIAALGFAGYHVLSMNKKPNTPATLMDPSPSATPKTLKTKDDIKQANNSLDNEEIDQNLNPDQLNQELDSIY